jgi:DNA-binding MurR/RpiR family transcriptional regulator
MATSEKEKRQRRFNTLIFGLPKNANRGDAIDWEFIEREYRVGRMTISEIARQAGCVRTLISRKAGLEGWTRDLSARVRTEVAARLAPSLSPETESDAVSIAAARSVQVVREHQAAIGRSQRILGKLFGELEDVTDGVGHSLDLETKAKVIGMLAGASRTFITLERQAFNLSADSDLPSRPTRAIDKDTNLKEAADIYAADLHGT